MVLVLFVGSMFLGFALGFATMAMLAAETVASKANRRQRWRIILPRAYSPARKFSPALRTVPQASRVLLTPQL